MVAFNYEEQEGKEYLVYNKRTEDKIDRSQWTMTGM